jgi:hypothetical protein
MQTGLKFQDGRDDGIYKNVSDVCRQTLKRPAAKKAKRTKGATKLDNSVSWYIRFYFAHFIVSSYKIGVFIGTA